MLLRIAQALAVFYLAMALLFPHMRVENFLNAGFHEVFMARQPEFWLFALPLTLGLVLSLFSGLLMLRRRPDRAESLRLLAFAIAAPFMASGIVVPNTVAPVAMAIGLLIFLVGAVQYHVIQGQRAHFMSKSSAAVAQLVGGGLKARRSSVELGWSLRPARLHRLHRGDRSTKVSTPARVIRRVGARRRMRGTIKDRPATAG